MRYGFFFFLPTSEIPYILECVEKVCVCVSMCVSVLIHVVKGVAAAWKGVFLQHFSDTHLTQHR